MGNGRVFKVGPDNHGIVGSASIPNLEGGFVNPELYSVLTPEEKSELQRAYQSYGDAAARSDYYGKKVWDRENVVDWTGEWQRGISREVEAKNRLNYLVEQYAQKHGMAIVTEQPKENKKTR